MRVALTLECDLGIIRTFFGTKQDARNIEVWTLTSAWGLSTAAVDTISPVT
jgi:hypothetical protein